MILKCLNKTKFLRRVWLCQGNLDWRQGKVREMSGNFVLPSLYEPIKVEKSENFMRKIVIISIYTSLNICFGTQRTI